MKVIIRINPEIKGKTAELIINEDYKCWAHTTEINKNTEKW